MEGLKAALADRYVLERELGRTAVRELLPAQPGDVPDTFADTERLARATGWLT